MRNRGDSTLVYLLVLVVTLFAIACVPAEAAEEEVPFQWGVVVATDCTLLSPGDSPTGVSVGESIGEAVGGWAGKAIGGLAGGKLAARPVYECHSVVAIGDEVHLARSSGRAIQVKQRVRVILGSNGTGVILNN